MDDAAMAAATSVPAFDLGSLYGIRAIGSSGSAVRAADVALMARGFTPRRPSEPEG
jgi:hypothetical protein